MVINIEDRRRRTNGTFGLIAGSYSSQTFKGKTGTRNFKKEARNLS
jgi:hypothetical protein